jgi:hypothetical protein
VPAGRQGAVTAGYLLLGLQTARRFCDHVKEGSSAARLPCRARPSIPLTRCSTRSWRTRGALCRRGAGPPRYDKSGRGMSGRTVGRRDVKTAASPESRSVLARE